MSEYGYGNNRYGGIRFAWPDWVFTDAVSGFIDVESDSATAFSQIDANSDGILSDGSIGLVDLEFDNFSAEVEVFGSLSQSDIETNADSGQVGVLASIGRSQIVGSSVNGEVDIEGTIGLPDIEFDSTSGDVEVLGTSTIVILEHNSTSGQVNVSGEAVDLSDLSSIINADGVSGTIEIDGSDSTTNWDAYLGGVVKDPSGTTVEGAEVHILKDNDDTLAASTTTDANGEWSVTLPAGNDPRPDPPVFSIEVWYRDGDKRDSNATVFNATNRPFIDTADPSETDPYTDPYPYDSG